MFYNSTFFFSSYDSREYWIENKIDQLKIRFFRFAHKTITNNWTNFFSLIVVIDDDVFASFHRILCDFFFHIHDRYYFSLSSLTNSDSRKIEIKKMTNSNYKLTRATKKHLKLTELNVVYISTNRKKMLFAW